MNEPEFGNKVRHLLNQGAQLEPRAAERLRAARELALARRKAEPASRLAWAGGLVGRLGGLGGLSLRLVLPVALLGGRADHDLRLAAEPEGGRVRRHRQPAAGRRSADRRLPRQGLRRLAQETRRALSAGARCLAALCGALAIALASRALAAAPQNKNPSWSQLSPQQREILAPLAGEWDKLDPQRKKKWLGVAKRYPKMTPIGKKRVQTRMRKWAELTPAQREEARKKYQRIDKLPPAKREALRKRWKEYEVAPAAAARSERAGHPAAARRHDLRGHAAVRRGLRLDRAVPARRRRRLRASTAGGTSRCRLYLGAVFAGYFLWCWLRGGQTLAMKAWHIRLVAPGRASVPPGKALLRFVLAALLVPSGIGILWALFDPERQFLHDRLAGTRLRLGRTALIQRRSTHHIISTAARKNAALGTAAAATGGQFCSRPMCENRLLSMWKKVPSMMPEKTLTPTMPARAWM